MTDSTDTKTIGELNREFFNKGAAEAFTIPWIQDLIAQISNYLRENVDWIGISHKDAAENACVKILDYACGNGTVSMALAPFASVLRGIDISDGMVELYNAGARKQNLSWDQMHARQGNLLEEPEKFEDPDLFGFDVALISMSLHHVENAPKMIEKLAERLRPGGSLVVIDWVSPQESGCGFPPKPAHLPAVETITYHGFTEKQMLDMFNAAGLTDIGYKWHPERSKGPKEIGGEQQLFFARGTKP